MAWENDMYRGRYNDAIAARQAIDATMRALRTAVQ
jgi:hypothetical protein